MVAKKSKRAHRVSGTEGSLRQLIYPKAMRIGPPPSLRAQLSSLEELLRMLQAGGKRQQAPSGEANAELLKIVALTAVGLWRIRQKLTREGTDEPIEGARKAFRHLQSLWDGLAEAGVTIRDHTGEVLPGGGAYALNILEFQPRAGVTREVVVETIKPTVYFQGRMLQVGEVIVAVPGNAGSVK